MVWFDAVCGVMVTEHELALPLIFVRLHEAGLLNESVPTEEENDTVHIWSFKRAAGRIPNFICLNIVFKVSHLHHDLTTRSFGL